MKKANLKTEKINNLEGTKKEKKAKVKKYSNHKQNQIAYSKDKELIIKDWVIFRKLFLEKIARGNNSNNKENNYTFSNLQCKKYLDSKGFVTNVRKTKDGYFNYWYTLLECNKLQRLELEQSNK